MKTAKRYEELAHLLREDARCTHLLNLLISELVPEQFIESVKVALDMDDQQFATELIILALRRKDSYETA